MQPQTYGVVDLGSNTIHLLVARSDGQGVEPLVDLSEGLRLGGDVDRDGEVGPQKLDALVATLHRFQEAAAAAGAGPLHLLATHAIRAADNQGEIRDAVQAGTGLRLQILSPEQEAALAFAAAAAARPAEGMRAVLDIGGGSMQVVLGRGETLHAHVSLPLGAARLARAFLPDDPPSEAQESALRSYLAETVSPVLPHLKEAPQEVIGAGGSLRRLPALVRGRMGEPLPAATLDSAIALLHGRRAAALVEDFDLPPERVRLLLPSVLVTRQVLRDYGDCPLTVIPFGIREGAILELARGGGAERDDAP